jgi:hypothetical protein
MAYFIFLKNLDNVLGSIYRIAENQFDLDNLNINKLDYKIIEDSEVNFNLVKYSTKFIQKYSGNTISYIDSNIVFENKSILNNYITNTKNLIKIFLDNNKNHPLFNNWNNYYNQLTDLNLDSISYPLNNSLEQYFKDLNQSSYHPLQLP